MYCSGKNIKCFADLCKSLSSLMGGTRGERVWGLLVRYGYTQVYQPSGIMGWEIF